MGVWTFCPHSLFVKRKEKRNEKTFEAVPLPACFKRHPVRSRYRGGEFREV